MSYGDCFLYRSDGSGPTIPLAPEYQAHVWTPAGPLSMPPGGSSKMLRIWSLFHALHVFASRDYGVLCILSGGEVVHRSLVQPRFFRYPFMGAEDLNIGDTWTHPDHRGKGLASAAIHLIFQERRRPGRTFWYICEADNVASQRAAEKAGFVKLGLIDRVGSSLTAKWVPRKQA